MSEITAQMIATAIATAYDVEAADILTMRQDPRLIWPRDVAIWATSQLTRQTPGQIGMAFGGRDGIAIQASLDRVRRQSAGQAVADELQAVLDAIGAVAQARRRTHRGARVQRPAEEIARQVVACGRGATAVSADDIRVLAGAVLVERWSGETRALVDAALEVASATPAAPGAPAPGLEPALSNLVIAVGAHLASMAGGREATRHG